AADPAYGLVFRKPSSPPDGKTARQPRPFRPRRAARRCGRSREALLSGRKSMLFDFAQLTARERHRILISTIVPRPIAWVVTEDERSTLNVAPFSFFNVFAE